MSTPTVQREDLLADSEATLRQVSGVLSDLAERDGDQGEPVASEGSSPGPHELMSVLLRAYGELSTVITMLRQSRGALHRAALARIHRTHEKLQEVTSTTEVAATDMLDGLDRALGFLDQMESEAPADAGESGDKLREELHGLISLLQFQDITSQQLGYASGVLTDVEKRLSIVRDALALGDLDEEELDDEPVALEEEEDVGHVVHDPSASTSDAVNRQALADEIFGG